MSREPQTLIILHTQLEIRVKMAGRRPRVTKKKKRKTTTTKRSKSKRHNTRCEFVIFNLPKIKMDFLLCLIRRVLIFFFFWFVLPLPLF